MKPDRSAVGLSSELTCSAHPLILNPLNDDLIAYPTLQFLREMAQPSEVSQVSLGMEELQRHSCYVERVAQTGISQHPMQAIDSNTLSRRNETETGEMEITAMDTS